MAQIKPVCTAVQTIGIAPATDNSHDSVIRRLDIVSDLYTAEGVMDKNSLWLRYVPLVRHEALRLQVRLPASVELDDLLQAGE